MILPSIYYQSEQFTTLEQGSHSLSWKFKAKGRRIHTKKISYSKSRRVKIALLTTEEQREC